MVMKRIFIWEDPKNPENHYLHIHHSERQGFLQIEAGETNGDMATVCLPEEKLGEMIQSLCKAPVHDALKGMLPVVCYFGSEADRDEFIAAVMAAKPGMRAVKP